MVMKHLTADGDSLSPRAVLDLSFIEHEGPQNQRLRSKIKCLTRVMRPILHTQVIIARLVHAGLLVWVLSAVSPNN